MLNSFYLYMPVTDILTTILDAEVPRDKSLYNFVAGPEPKLNITLIINRKQIIIDYLFCYQLH